MLRCDPTSRLYILRALAFLFLTQAVLAQQPAPILPDRKLTPGDTFDVTDRELPFTEQPLNINSSCLSSAIEFSHSFAI